mgnify:CR=1 FL=1
MHSGGPDGELGASHFQRFGSAIQQVREQLDQKNVYYTNPAFDR